MPLAVCQERKSNMNEKFEERHWEHSQTDCLHIKVEQEERGQRENGLEFVCVKLEREDNEESDHIEEDNEESERIEVKIEEVKGELDALASPQEAVSFPTNARIQIEVDLVKQEPTQDDELSSQQNFQAKPSEHLYNSCLESICNIVESKDCQNQKGVKNLKENIPLKRQPKEKVPGKKRARTPKDGPPRKRGRPRKERKKLTERKIHVCETCSKRFVLMKSLIIHVRTHTGERPFPCTDCGKNFISSSQLASHSRVHAMNKPLYCHICTKQFMHKCNLNRHFQVHSGEKRYACRFCEKSFLRSSNLKRHLRIHTYARKALHLLGL